MIKRIFALLLAVLMVAGLFAGCGEQQKPNGGDIILPKPTQTDASGNVIENQKPYEGVTITMAFYSNYEIDANAWLFKQIEEATGIIIEPICYTSAVYFEKLGGWIATNDLPDLITSGNLDKTEFDKYGSQGAFVNLNDPEVLEMIPNFKKIFIDDPDNYAVYSQYFTETGAQYAAPSYDMNRDVNHCLLYREDVFKELGIEPWTDTDSFLAALRKLKQAYPTSYPFNASAWDQNLSRMAYSFNVNGLEFAYDHDTKQWYSGVTSNDFRKLLDLWQIMYKEKLMDPDVFTNDSSTIDAKMLTNQSFVIQEWIGRMAVENAAAATDKDGKVDDSFHVVPGAPIGNGKYIELGKFSGAGGLLVKNGPKQNAVLAVLDWLYSDEGSYIASVGVEGDNYVKDENGKITYPDITLKEGEVITYQMLTEKYGMWLDGYYVRTSRDAIYYDYTPEEKMAQDLGAKHGYYPGKPAMNVPSAYQFDWADHVDAYTKDYEEFVTNYIMKGYGDAEWNKFVSDIQKDYGFMFDILNGKK